MEVFRLSFNKSWYRCPECNVVIEKIVSLYALPLHVYSVFLLLFL